MRDVRAYAELVGVRPTTIIQRAKCGGGGTWDAWVDGTSSPTHKTTDRLKAYMQANPRAAVQVEDAA